MTHSSIHLWPLKKGGHSYRSLKTDKQIHLFAKQLESFSYEWETYGTDLLSRHGIKYMVIESSIQPITLRKIIAEAIGMPGHGTITAQTVPYRTSRSHSHKNDSM